MQAYPGVLQLSKESLQGPSEPRGHQLHDMVPGRADEAAGLATNRRLSSGLPQTIRQSSAVSVHGSMAVNSPDSPVLLWFPSGWTLLIRCRLRACMASPPPQRLSDSRNRGGCPPGSAFSRWVALLCHWPTASVFAGVIMTGLGPSPGVSLAVSALNWNGPARSTATLAES